jgi:hypothetical protein
MIPIEVNEINKICKDNIPKLKLSLEYKTANSCFETISVNHDFTSKQILEIATQKLPADILRIIASKYRRKYEIKPSLSPKARTVLPNFEDDNEIHYNIDDITYELYKHHSGCLFNKSYRMIIYDNKIQKVIVSLLYFPKGSTFQCNLRQDIPVRILYTALTLFKRNGFEVDGKSPILFYKNAICICPLTYIRDVLYDDIYAFIWKKDPLIKEKCSIM